MNQIMFDGEWTLNGWGGNHLVFQLEIGCRQNPEFSGIPATVPGSVQKALFDAGIIPDWNFGFNARQIEWVENRHWEFATSVDVQPGRRYELVLPGIDSEGWVAWDGKLLGSFRGGHSVHRFTLPVPEEKTHTLSLCLASNEKFAGQIGRTEHMTVFKPRFYFLWDWIPRLVQLGIHETPYLRDLDAPELALSELWTDADAAAGLGSVRLRGNVRGADRVVATLSDGTKVIRREELSADRFSSGVLLQTIPVELWQPNLNGEQKLYTLTLEAEGAEKVVRSLGFKQIRWLHAPGREDADPWVCEINGRPTFLQGVNWTPIRAFFADLRPEDYRKRLEIYREIGCNVLRIWGGGILEPDYFYELCDEMGLMVWQEFPMSSSGISCAPPADGESIGEMRRIADRYLERCTGHVSLLAWSGGNEIMNGRDPVKRVPCEIDEPILGMLASLVRLRDPHRRFMPSSPSGPCCGCWEKFYGTGKLWDVHGPWSWAKPLADGWAHHWDADDSLFRGEFGLPAASTPEMIRKYAGQEPVFPCSPKTPIWRYPAPWLEDKAFRLEFGRDPESLEEYCGWSRARQAEGLKYALGRMKSRFPFCGGGIVWMGHDSFPCAANTSVIDYEGNPKPACEAMKWVFRNSNSIRSTVFRQEPNKKEAEYV